VCEANTGIGTGHDDTLAFEAHRPNVVSVHQNEAWLGCGDRVARGRCGLLGRWKLQRSFADGLNGADFSQRGDRLDGIEVAPDPERIRNPERLERETALREERFHGCLGFFGQTGERPMYEGPFLLLRRESASGAEIGLLRHVDDELGLAVRCRRCHVRSDLRAPICVLDFAAARRAGISRLWRRDGDVRQ
jgi:hypothetical protein